jgi:hypothetical protein
VGIATLDFVIRAGSSNFIINDSVTVDCVIVKTEQTNSGLLSPILVSAYQCSRVSIVLGRARITKKRKESSGDKIKDSSFAQQSRTKCRRKEIHEEAVSNQEPYA